MVRYLPESASYLVAHGRRDEAEAVARRYGLELESPAAPVADQAGEGAAATVRTLFTPAFVRNTVVIGVTTFMGLLLVYGLNNWLPTIMREAGYDLGDSLAFLLVLNVGDRRTPGRRHGRRPDRCPRGGHRLVRRRRRLPRAAVDQAAHRRHLRDGLPDRLLRVQRAGARLRLRQREPPAAATEPGQSRGGLRSWSARKRSNSAPISSALGTSPPESRSVPSRAAVNASYCCSRAATTAVFSVDRPICSSTSVRCTSAASRRV